MLKPGTMINERYEIIEKVGSGGMADVYKAKCHKLNRYVAFKVLKAEFSDDKNFVNKFREEAQACAGLSHPNIVNIYDVGDEDDVHFIVMELVEGITLKNYIERKGKLEIKEAVGIAIQIAKGMEVAHFNNIVHRDIKPQNIIISKEGKVKVTDFGIAKAINSNTITSNTMGSVHYLSPEQARGGYSDEKSDIYSLGVTLYEMLSGRVPFVGDNTVSVALLHIQSEPIPLRELDPNIPVSIERIVQKAMQKKPERRYLSATDLIADLKKSIEDPSGNFVVIPATPDLESPTITMSDEELKIIKSVSANAMNSNGGYNNMDSKDNPNFYDEELDDDYYDDEEQDGEYDDDFLEEDADEVDPRMEKVLLIGTIVAAIVVVVIILVALNNILDFSPGSGEEPTIDAELTITPEPSPTPEVAETFSMPYVIKLRYEEAYDLLKKSSENIPITTTEEYSDTVEKGLIMEQYPDEGIDVSEDSQVRLVISAGKESFDIPDVSNYSEQQATTVLTDLGLIVNRDYKNSNDIAEGKVISTTPANGSKAVKGDTITVVVSSGPDTKYVAVPDLSGMDEDAAKRRISESGLTNGNVSEETNYSNIKKGIVVGQSHAAGTEVEEGTAISIILSKGPEPTPSPTPEPTPTPIPTPTNVEPQDPGDGGVEEGQGE